jgi:hypothetical protein
MEETLEGGRGPPLAVAPLEREKERERDKLSVCEILKKNLESYSLYRRKKYHDPLRILFVVNF